jgi:hypothetical protein
MMHPVHNGIGTRTHIRGALGDVCKNEKHSFPGFTHFKSAMCGIPVLEKRLAKQRGIPEHDKKDEHRHKKIIEMINKRK